MQKLIGVYIVLLLIYALLSWIPSLRGRWSDYLAMVIEPVLQPLRRIIPPISGLDISFIVLLILLRFIQARIVPQSCFYIQ